MMRSALLWASRNPFLTRRLPRTKFVRAAAKRFMPGESAEDALAEAARLAERGAGVLLTYLGENVETEEEAQGVCDRYLGVMDDARGRALDAEISVKPTHLGLGLGDAIAKDHLLRLVEAAGDRTVWIDMESSSYVDRTLDLYRSVRERYPNVGVCLQAYLRRTPEDLEDLLPLHPSIRLVKGAYAEVPEVAFAQKRQVDVAYARLATRMLQQARLGRMGRVGLGTHDEKMVHHAMARAHELGLAASGWEVETLFGIAPDLQRWLLSGNTQLRVLISFGSEWFSWYMRRLAERPANLLFVAKKLVGL